MKILAIGGTGFIGRHVVRQLIDKGFEVAVFHRGEMHADLPPDVEHIYGNRNELSKFAKQFERFAPEVVLDIIPYTENQALAVVGTLKHIARRIVVLSSGDVYRNYDGLRGVGNSPPDPVPLTEDAPLRERFYPYRNVADGPENWLYHYDKILVEDIFFRVFEVLVTVLRLPKVYGPDDPRHTLFPYLKRMDDGRPAILLEVGQADWLWTRGYVENVAAAITLAVVDECTMGRVYNIGEPTALSEAEWIRRIGEAVGWNGEVIKAPKQNLPDHLQIGYNWQYHLALDVGKFRKELNYTDPISPEEALKRTIVWERSHPPEAINSDQFDYKAEDGLLARLT